MKNLILFLAMSFLTLAGYAQTLTLGRGLTGGSYNGGANVTTTLDTSQNYTWLKVQTALKNSLGQTTADGYILKNSTAATSSVQQYSPSLTFMSNGWNTAVSASQAFNYRMYVTSASASGLIDGNLGIELSQNGGAYSNVFKLDQFGDLNIAGHFDTFNGISTSTDGLFFAPSINATSGTPAILSGRIRFDGNGWNTTSSASQSTDFIIENRPISGSTVTSKLVISSQINGGGYTERLALLNTGLFYLNGTALTGNQLVGANSGATGMEAKTLSGSAGTGAVVTNGTGTITFSNDTTTLETISNFFPKGDTRYLKTTTAATTYQPLLGYTAANNASVVHLTGNENIAGNKTFSNLVGIGTSTIPTGYVFAINGNTIATSITIKAEANWPDYVFADQYKLRPLSEVAAFLKANHHLPDMPSALEVAKNGQDLGEMNEKLVKKIEELTLYMIEKDKQLKEQKKIIADQQARLAKIEKLLKIDSGN